MAIITKSIGTIARDFNTITLWEADHTAQGANDLVGEMFDDSVFDESVVFNDTTPTSVLLRSATTDRHDGIAGTGARIVRTAGVGSVLKVDIGNTTIEYVEIDANAQSTNIGIQCTTNSVSNNVFNGNIIHNINAGTSGIGIRIDETTSIILSNNFIYRIRAGNSANGIFLGGNNTSANIVNNTIATSETGSGTLDVVNLDISASSDVASNTQKNNLCLDPIGTTSGTKADYRATTNVVTDFNGASDSSAQGGNSLNSLTSGNEVISTTAGSENLQLISTATVISQGTDLTTTGNKDIHEFDRNGLLTLVWDMGGHQRLITSTIGTTGRDFSTWTLYEAGMSTTSGAINSDSVGNTFADSDFDENVIFNDATPASVVITAATGEEHSGLANTGVRMVASVDVRNVFLSQVVDTELSLIEFDGNGKNSARVFSTISGGSHLKTVKQCLIHDILSTDGDAYGIELKGGADQTIVNNFIYAIKNDEDNSKHTAGVNEASGSAALVRIMNNSILNMTSDQGTGTCSCFRWQDETNKTLQNNIGTDTSGTTSGIIQDYSRATVTFSTVDHNIASDTSASGTGSIDSVTSASLFVSTTLGSENLHLLDTAVAIGAGLTIGTTPAGVDVDIDGTTRGAIWDIGADENPLDTPDLVAVTKVNKRNRTFFLFTGA